MHTWKKMTTAGNMPHALRRTRSQASEEYYASGSIRLPGDLAYNISQAEGRTITSHQSSDGSNPVHEDGFSNEAFRAGGPYLCKMPTSTSPVPKGHPAFGFIENEKFRLAKETFDLLPNRGISPAKMVGFFYEQSKYEPEPEPTLTLSFVTTREAFDDLWLDVSREIYDYLCRNGLPECSVDICDEKRGFGPEVFFPVREEDPISANWPSIFSSIWTRCALDDVSSIGCFRIGTSDKPEDNPLTIFVTVNSNTGRDWRGMRREIVRILDSHNLPIVAVKIQADKILRGTRGNALSDPDGFIADSAISGPAQVGQSLGRAKVQDGSGTFGGFLELRYPESQNWVTYGIICSQCVLPGEDQVKSSDAHLLQEWCRNGFGPENEIARSMLRVEQPSVADIQRTIETCDKNIQKVISERQIQINDAGEFVIPADEKNPNVKIILDNYQGIKSCVEEFWRLNRHHLGSVFAASRERVEESVTMPSVENPECHVDWALIDVPSHCVGGNEKWVFFSEGRKLWGPYPRTLTPGLAVYKCGHVTKYTKGKYNGIMTALITHDLVNGVKVAKCTWAHTVTNHFREPFWAPGDTGAAVFDIIGTMVGLLFAGNERSRVSYFAHVYDLFDDIKQVTGAAEVRVMEPPFDEEEKS